MSQLTFLKAENFQKLFSNKLQELSSLNHLGTYILALANALSDKQIHTLLEPSLKQEKQNLLKNRPKSSIDDNLVFDQIIQQNKNNLSVLQSKKVGFWIIQYHPIRAFRPARNAEEKIASLFKAFNPDGFHFNKPFLEKEKLIEFEFSNQTIKLFFNKFPLSKNHLLLLLSPAENNAQLLSKNNLKTILALSKQVSLEQPFAYLAFNSIGAYASVNHLHFHLNILDAALPITNIRWLHNGGVEPYPVDVIKFSEAQKAWSFIQELHEKDQAYNLIFEDNTVYCIARKFQQSYQLANWCGNVSWLEIAGVFTIPNKMDYDNLNEQQITSELAKLKV